MGKSKLTPYQRRLKEMRKDERLTEAVKQKAAIEAISTLYVMLVYTMYFFYGWKTKRITRVITQFRQIYTSIIKGERTLEALADEIEKETKIKIDVKTGSLKLPDFLFIDRLLQAFGKFFAQSFCFVKVFLGGDEYHPESVAEYLHLQTFQPGFDVCGRFSAPTIGTEYQGRFFAAVHCVHMAQKLPDRRNGVPIQGRRTDGKRIAAV